MSLHRSSIQFSRFAKTFLMLTLVVTFAIGAATPAMALSAKKKRATIRIIKAAAADKQLSKRNVRALLKICKRESGFRRTARNRSCKGLFQLKTRYSKRKWANPRWNTLKAIRYIKHRYGSARAALGHCNRYGWY